MKLAFSTLGVPGLPLPDVVRLAAEHGYHGVELRAGHEEPVHSGLTERQRADVAGKFRDAGVAVLAVASHVQVAAPGEDAPALRGLRDHVRLAADLGAPYVRVFPGAGDDDGDAADTRAAHAAGGSGPGGGGQPACGSWWRPMTRTGPARTWRGSWGWWVITTRVRSGT